MLCLGGGEGRIPRIAPGVEHAARHGAIEEAGVEMREAKMLGKAAGERSLA